MILKRVHTTVLLLFLSMNSYGQSTKRDVIVYSESITINHLSSRAIDSLKTLSKSKFNSITFGKLASQADFDWTCVEFRGVKRVMIESSNDSICDISKVALLDSLEELLALHITCSPIDMEVISKLSRLTSINFNSTKVTNTNALKNLTNLRKARFYLSQLSSISFLYNTPKLEVLELFGFQHTFENYEPVAGLKELKELAIYMNLQATDSNLAVLTSLENLRKIHLGNCYKVTSLNFLQNNQNLEEINATWCHLLKDFTALSNFKKLKRLSLEDTGLENLNDLEGITTLENVDFSYTDLRDISKLKNCPDLLYIDIVGTKVEDLSPLKSCKKLKRVYVSSSLTNLQEQIDDLKILNPNLEVRISK